MSKHGPYTNVKTLMKNKFKKKMGKFFDKKVKYLSVFGLEDCLHTEAYFILPSSTHLKKRTKLLEVTFYFYFYFFSSSMLQFLNFMPTSN